MIGSENSPLYMWEPAENEDDSEFESDFIASTNEFVLTNKVLHRYESEYFRSDQVNPGELTGRAHHLARKYEEEAKDLDLSCIYDERNDVSLDELD
jgi:hypothetical protein